jgi:hypothetical protein
MAVAGYLCRYIRVYTAHEHAPDESKKGAAALAGHQCLMVGAIAVCTYIHIHMCIPFMAVHLAAPVGRTTGT